MENYERFNDAKEAKEAIEIVDKYLKLQSQINNPTKFGMIDALSDAKRVASEEIASLEWSQGDIYPMPWTSFSDKDLQRKLKQYQEGLRIHAINKIGEKAFKELLEECAKNQNWQR